MLATGIRLARFAVIPSSRVFVSQSYLCRGSIRPFTITAANFGMRSGAQGVHGARGTESAQSARDVVGSHGASGASGPPGTPNGAHGVPNGTPGIWGKIKHEAKHYWDGTKLLGYEVKVSSKLALKLASGRDLSRREDRQLRRTTQDLGRLVPFSIFVLIPFAELLLPLALKVFPNLLPSTYETANAKSAKTHKLGATRAKVANYLRDSMKTQQMLVPDFVTEDQKLEFDDFFRKLRDGEQPGVDQLLNVSRMFKDDVLLDNLSRPQLAAIAKYMGIQGLGSSNILRYQIRHKTRFIKHDDRIIDYEGVDSLNAIELQNACQFRGFRTIGVSTGRLRDDLNTWLRLRLRDKVPATLLILSTAFTYGLRDIESTYDGLIGVLSALPAAAYHETALEIQGNDTDTVKKLEVLKEQDRLIREENKEERDSGHVLPVSDSLSIDEPRHNPDHQNVQQDQNAHKDQKGQKV